MFSRFYDDSHDAPFVIRAPSMIAAASRSSEFNLTIQYLAAANFTCVGRERGDEDRECVAGNAAFVSPGNGWEGVGGWG